MPDSTVDYALSHVSPNRNIVAEHVQWLARLETSHEAELGGDIDGKVLQRYLATKHVLAYLNGETWYAVHPMLRDWVLQRAAAMSANGAKSAVPPQPPVAV